MLTENTDFKNLYFPLTGSIDLVNKASELSFNSILDIGFGSGSASIYFALQNKQVTGIGLDIESYNYPKDIFNKYNIQTQEINFEQFNPIKKFDAVWASHVMEHMTNPGLFLKKCNELLNDNGWLFIMVPPYKSQVVGGHITTGWNLGQLMYNLLLQGFDIKNGHFIKHGYNICAFVQKSQEKLPEIRMDDGDIETTKHLWPLDVYQGFEGDLDRVNWFNDFEIYNFETEKFESENYIPNIEKKSLNQTLEERNQSLLIKEKVISNLKRDKEQLIKDVKTLQELCKKRLDLIHQKNDFIKKITSI